MEREATSFKVSVLSPTYSTVLILELTGFSKNQTCLQGKLINQ